MFAQTLPFEVHSKLQGQVCVNFKGLGLGSCSPTKKEKKGEKGAKKHGRGDEKTAAYKKPWTP